ncbi:hypothetical protein ACLKA6_020028 [Drosophila palustris]
MFDRNKSTETTTSRTPQRQARGTTLYGQGAVQGILLCSAGSMNYWEIVKGDGCRDWSHGQRDLSLV